VASLIVTLAEKANIPDPAEVQERLEGRMPNGVTLEGVSVSGSRVTLHLSQDLTAQQRATAEAFFAEQSWTTATGYRTAKQEATRTRVRSEIDAITNLAGAKEFLKRLADVVIERL
jgi:capsule polysaccharide export protein KpsE/RkpR